MFEGKMFRGWNLICKTFTPRNCGSEMTLSLLKVPYAMNAYYDTDAMCWVWLYN